MGVPDRKTHGQSGPCLLRLPLLQHVTNLAKKTVGRGPPTMRSENKPAFDFNHMPPRDLLMKSTVVYGFMIVVGLLVMGYGHETLSSALTWALPRPELLRFLVIGLIGAGLLQILSFFFEDWFPSYRELKSVVMRLLGPLSVPTAMYVSLMTALGEEIAFRGAIQPFAGLFITSFLFGLMHVGPGGLLSAWSLWAMIAGGLLGWMFDETKSLWPCIVAHFVVNFASMMMLRKQYRALQKTSPKEAPSDLDQSKALENESDSRA